MKLKDVVKNLSEDEIFVVRQKNTGIIKYKGDSQELPNIYKDLEVVGTLTELTKGEKEVPLYVVNEEG